MSTTPQNPASVSPSKNPKPQKPSKTAGYPELQPHDTKSAKPQTNSAQKSDLESHSGGTVVPVDDAKKQHQSADHNAGE